VTTAVHSRQFDKLRALYGGLQTGGTAREEPRRRGRWGMLPSWGKRIEAAGTPINQLEESSDNSALIVQSPCYTARVPGMHQLCESMRCRVRCRVILQMRESILRVAKQRLSCIWTWSPEEAVSLIEDDVGVWDDIVLYAEVVEHHCQEYAA
jgi:hypothetical protein